MIGVININSKEYNSPNVELSRNERKILRYLRVPITHIERVHVTTEVISNRLNIDYDEAKYLVNHLINFGFIKYEAVFHDQTPINLELTPKGKNFLSKYSEKTLNRIFWNIIIPIFTSIIVSLLTTYYVNK